MMTHNQRLQEKLTSHDDYNTRRVSMCLASELPGEIKVQRSTIQAIYAIQNTQRRFLKL